MVLVSGTKEIVLDSDTDEPQLVFVVGPMRKVKLLELVSSGDYDPDDEEDMARLGVRALISMIRKIKHVKKDGRLITVSGRAIEDVLDAMPPDMWSELFEKLAKMAGIDEATEKNSA